MTNDDGRQTTDDRRRATDNGRQATGDRRRTTDDGRQTTDDRRPTTGDRRQTTDDRRQSSVIGLRSSVINHRSSVSCNQKRETVSALPSHESVSCYPVTLLPITAITINPKMIQGSLLSQPPASSLTSLIFSTGTRTSLTIVSALQVPVTWMVSRIFTSLISSLSREMTTVSVRRVSGMEVSATIAAITRVSCTSRVSATSSSG